MNQNHPTEQVFLKDVAAHEMTVIRDDGVYRHIRFKRPSTTSFYFDLITWPGHLCYTGDMGTYVFSRTRDMLEFFRCAQEDTRLPEGRKLVINPQYWSEKLQAADCNGASIGRSKVFSAEKFKAAVSELRLGWIREAGLGKAARRELWDAVRDEVLGAAKEDELAALSAARDFYHSDSESGRWFDFSTIWGCDLKEYTYRFIWCCYALAWAIDQYDNAKPQEST